MKLLGMKLGTGQELPPIENTLFFAGEAAEASGEAATVTGALLSGEAAARAVLAARSVA